MKMIPIKANCLYRDPGHSAKQSRKRLANIRTDTRLQDLSAVFANPNNMVLQTIHTMSCLDKFHCGIVYRLKAHSSTAKAVVFCLRPHKRQEPIIFNTRREAEQFIDELIDGEAASVHGTTISAETYSSSNI